MNSEVYLLWDCKDKQVLCDNDDDIYCFVSPIVAKEFIKKIMTSNPIIVIKGDLTYG